METKIIAAEIATGAGVTTIITSSKRPENIFSIIEYHNSIKSVPTPDASRSQGASPTPNARDSASPGLKRPPHTLFTASAAPVRDLKAWTSHTLFPAGSVVIDAGAHHVLSRRESGGRLLAVGVLGVIGAFASGQAVRVVVLARTNGSDPAARASYMAALQKTRPSTPIISEDGTQFKPTPLVPDEDLVSMERGEQLDEADVIEVGRGLANYNSAQITKVKGLNRFVYPGQRFLMALMFLLAPIFHKF